MIKVFALILSLIGFVGLILGVLGIFGKDLVRLVRGDWPSWDLFSL